MKRFVNPLLSLAAPFLILVAGIGLFQREGSDRLQSLPALLVGTGLIISSDSIPGSFIIKNKVLIIATGFGFIESKYVQLEGSKKITATDFINSNQDLHKFE